MKFAHVYLSYIILITIAFVVIFCVGFFVCVCTVSVCVCACIDGGGCSTVKTCLKLVLQRFRCKSRKQICHFHDVNIGFLPVAAGKFNDCRLFAQRNLCL